MKEWVMLLTGAILITPEILRLVTDMEAQMIPELGCGLTTVAL